MYSEQCLIYLCVKFVKFMSSLPITDITILKGLTNICWYYIPLWTEQDHSRSSDLKRTLNNSKAYTIRSAVFILKISLQLIKVFNKVQSLNKRTIFWWFWKFLWSYLQYMPFNRGFPTHLTIQNWILEVYYKHHIFKRRNLGMPVYPCANMGAWEIWMWLNSKCHNIKNARAISGRAATLTNRKHHQNILSIWNVFKHMLFFTARAKELQIDVSLECYIFCREICKFPPSSW
jgi:hypothetical protein